MIASLKYSWPFIWVPRNNLGQWRTVEDSGGLCCHALKETVPGSRFGKPAPLPAPLSLLQWDLLSSHFITGFMYLTSPAVCFLCSSLPAVSSTCFVSYSLSLSYTPPLSCAPHYSPSHQCPAPPPPPPLLLNFRQAIYIFLLGCLASHSLNKVCFIVFAHV